MIYNDYKQVFSDVNFNKLPLINVLPNNYAKYIGMHARGAPPHICFHNCTLPSLSGHRRRGCPMAHASIVFCSIKTLPRTFRPNWFFFVFFFFLVIFCVVAYNNSVVPVCKYVSLDKFHFCHFFRGLKKYPFQWGRGRVFRGNITHAKLLVINFNKFDTFFPITGSP